MTVFSQTKQTLVKRDCFANLFNVWRSRDPPPRPFCFCTCFCTQSLVTSPVPSLVPCPGASGGPAAHCRTGTEGRWRRPGTFSWEELFRPRGRLSGWAQCMRQGEGRSPCGLTPLGAQPSPGDGSFPRGRKTLRLSSASGLQPLLLSLRRHRGSFPSVSLLFLLLCGLHSSFTSSSEIDSNSNPDTSHWKSNFQKYLISLFTRIWLLASWLPFVFIWILYLSFVLDPMLYSF